MCRCPEDNTWNVPRPAGASPQGTGDDPNCNCVFVEEVGCFPVLEIDGLLIGPGCTGWGTWWSSFSQLCECMDSSLEPDENGDCLPDMGASGSGGGTGCDPSYENCDPDGGGGGGGGGDGGDNDPTLTLAEDMACRPDLGECVLVYDRQQWFPHEFTVLADALERLGERCPDLAALLHAYNDGGRIAFWRETVERYGMLVGGKWDFRETGDIWLYTGATRDDVIHEVVHAFLLDQKHPPAFDAKFAACR